jgi:predicted kinase
MEETNPILRSRCLVVLVGPPGSGKSTWARQNGRGAVHVSQDGLIDAITPNGFDHTYRPVYHAAEDGVARVALAANFTVIVDRTNRTKEHRRRWLKLAEDIQCAAVAVVMPAAASLCRFRNNLREGSRRLPDARMERMLACYEVVCPEEGFTAIFDGESVTLAGILAQLNSAKEET